MRLPYHTGSDRFGGSVPAIPFALFVFKGDLHYGPWYTIIVALMPALIGLLFPPETKDVDLSK